VYKEDVSETNQGELKHHKRKPKEVMQYTNVQNPKSLYRKDSINSITKNALPSNHQMLSAKAQSES